jgi:2-O-methyltransferase
MARSWRRSPEDGPLNRDEFLARPLPHQAALLRLLPRQAPLVIFDIGSCEGEDSIRYARLFPAARVWAVEALPANVDLIKANLARHGTDRVEVVALALTDSAGHATFHVSSGRPPNKPADTDWDYGNKSSSLLPPDGHLDTHPWVHFDDSTEVETDRLDALARRCGLTVIDYIHMDVQGAELRVLDGAGALLDSVRVIWMEVEAKPLYKDQPLKADVEKFMESRGFEKRLDTVGAISGDQLYVNTRYYGRSSGWKRVLRRLGLAS